MKSTLNYSRKKNTTYAIESKIFDICIIGGGIHGVAVAKLAAQNNLSVLLLEQSDYAAETSSRSSKMAHGGLRYLELFDFQQVFEGIKARENLYKEYPNLVKPYKFLIPIKKSAYFDRLKMHIGLFLYDLLVQKKERKHKWIKRSNLNFEGFNLSRTDLAGCFSYTDGILSDSRLVIENIITAREHGAIALNHAKVLNVSDSKDEVIEVNWQDQIVSEGEQINYTSRARLVINCAGPWAPFIKHSSLEKNDFKARYSQGSHILFNKKWTDPALFLPMEGNARYYFVWPHFAGTLVGTTEREVKELKTDPQPEKSEIEEILARLKEDLPNSGLNRETMHYAFAGVRTLPLRASKSETASLSRKHIWKLENGMLSLLGGKLTTAEWTAREALKYAFKYLKCEENSSKEKQANQEIINIELKFEIPASNKEHLYRRFGSRVSNVIQNSNDAEVLTPYLLRGELRYVIEVEQVETLEDLLRRRLEIEYLPNAWVEDLDVIVKACKNLISSNNFEKEVLQYKQRLERVYELLER
jgi:glycerol-3-phosphate dehydrogenase